MTPNPRLRSLIALATAFVCLLAAGFASPAWAGSWTGYVATSEPNQLVPFNTADKSTSTPIPLTNYPRDLAIAPDGKTIYVLAGSPDRLVPIDSSTGTAGTAIPIGGAVSVLALSPDGKAAYAVDINAGKVFKVDLATGSVSDPISVGRQVWGIAAHPDGGSLYVTTSNGGGVAKIRLSDNAITWLGDTGGSMKGIAFRPDGLFGYAISPGLNTAFPINVAASSLSPKFDAGYQPSELAITPDGTKAFVANFSSDKVAVLNLAENKNAGAIDVGTAPSDVAVSPDGKTAFVANEGSSNATPIDIAAGTAGAPIPISGAATPRWIAVTPNQPPTARLEAGPAWTGAPVRLDASSSVDPDGSIAAFEWDFGGGETEVTSGPVIERMFAKGTHDVSVTLTDDAGCSTEIVFTGQTASCNGSAEVARAHLSFNVTDEPPAPPTPPAPPADDGQSGGSGQPGDKADGPARLAPLKVLPRRLKAKSGSAVRLKLRVRNSGAKATGRLRICVRAPKRLVVPSRCKATRSVPTGRAVVHRLRLRLRKNVRSGQRLQIRFKVSGKAVKARSARVVLRVR